MDHCSAFCALYLLHDILILLLLPSGCGVLSVCQEYDGGVLFPQLFITTGLFCGNCFDIVNVLQTDAMFAQESYI